MSPELPCKLLLVSQECTVFITLYQGRSSSLYTKDNLGELGNTSSHFSYTSRPHLSSSDKEQFFNKEDETLKFNVHLLYHITSFTCKYRQRTSSAELRGTERTEAN